MKSYLLSLGVRKGCGEWTERGTKEFSMMMGMFFALFWWWFTQEHTMTKPHGMDYFMYVNYTLAKTENKTRREGGWGERMRKREERRGGGKERMKEGKRMDCGTDRSEESNHFSKLVVLYMPVFLKLHWAVVTITWKDVGFSTSMGKYTISHFRVSFFYVLLWKLSHWLLLESLQSEKLNEEMENPNMNRKTMAVRPA